MLVPRWRFLPDGLWEVVFGIIAVYFLIAGIRYGRQNGFEMTDDDHVHHFSHHLIHMVMSCAMFYMYWLGMPLSVSSASTMSMSGPSTGAGDAGLTFLIIVILIASAVWQLDAVSQFSAPRQLALISTATGGTSHSGEAEMNAPDDGQLLLAPRLEILCHVAMCLTMGYMLVLMV